MAIGPFRTELVVLNQHLGVAAIGASGSGCLDPRLNGGRLSRIRAKMLFVQADFPLSLVIHDEILGASHGALGD